MYDRRTVLAAGVAALSAAATGCVDSTSDGDGSDSPDTQAPPATDTATDEPAGKSDSPCTETDEDPPTRQVTNRLQVISTAGIVGESGARRTVDAVQLIATKAPGADDIDLTDVTMQWVDDSGTYDLVHASAWGAGDGEFGGADGAFATTAITDENESLSESAVVDSPDDRTRLVVALGPDGGASADGFDPWREDYAIRRTGLPEGAMATLRLVTASGSASTVRLVVPESLAGNDAVSL